MNRAIWILAFASTFTFGLAAACQGIQPGDYPDPRPPITEGETIDIAEVDVAALADWIREHGQPPIDFLISRFDDHDIVMIGEVHGLHEHAQFVADSIGPLYEHAGVRVLCSEFVRASQTERLQVIIEAEKWNEEAAIDLMRDAPWPTWGWREYVNIFEAAWEINAKRNPGSPPFRIIGIDDDWTQLGLMKADRMKSFKAKLHREEVMHTTTRDAANAYGPRVIVHVGAAHAVRHGIRISERLYRDFGDRVDYVILHHDMKTREGRSALTTMLEEAIAEAGFVDGKTVAFEIVGSPAARARDEGIPPFKMLGPAAGLEDFLPSVIFLAPVDAIERGRWIDGFINDYRFEEARELAIRLRMIEESEGETPAELDKLIKAKMASSG